jgi:hypothetical protein
VAENLVAEVLDHAPPEMGAPEVVILVAIAERMSRRIDIDYEQTHLRRRTRLSASGFRKAVQRLKDRGFEVRVPRGVDRTGRPTYAAYGQVSRWRLPVFEPPANCDCPTCEAGGPSSAADVLESRQCSPQCLLALGSEARSCSCRCRRGSFHGTLKDADCREALERVA